MLVSLLLSFRARSLRAGTTDTLKMHAESLRVDNCSTNYAEWKQFTVSGSVAGIDSNFPPEHLHHLIRVLAGVFRPAGTFVALPPASECASRLMPNRTPSEGILFCAIRSLHQRPWLARTTQ